MPRLPDPWLYLTIIPIVWLLVHASSFRVAGLIALGVLWAMWRAQLILDSRLDPSRAGHVFSIVGAISSRPVDIGIGQRFDFQARSVLDGRGVELPISRLKLAWYEPHLALFTRAMRVKGTSEAAPRHPQPG